MKEKPKARTWDMVMNEDGSCGVGDAESSGSATAVVVLSSLVAAPSVVLMNLVLL